MEEIYCSYDIASLLKKKGFNEPCMACYVFNANNDIPRKYHFPPIQQNNIDPDIYAAPTHQMVLKWLREVYNIYIMIDKDFATVKGWHYYIAPKDIWESNVDSCIQQESANYTYEEATEMAIKYTLQHLI